MIMQPKFFDNDYQIRSIEKYQLSDILDASVKRMRAQVTDRSSDQNEHEGGAIALRPRAFIYK